MKKITYRPVYNRKRQLNEQGNALLQVEAYLEKRKIYFSTHIYLTPDQWDSKKKIIKSHPNADALNGMLREFIIELERREIDLWRNGQNITLDKLKETFQTSNKHSFLSFIQKEIEGSQLKASTQRNRMTTHYLLKKFKPGTCFNDVDSKFVYEFERFLYENQYQVNTIAKHMRHLKSFVNAAINKGYIDSNDYAFRRYRIKMKEGKHVFLLPDEIKKLENLASSRVPAALMHTLDAFLFSCYTGVRYSDFRNLTEKNIVKIEGKPWLIFKTVKTDTEVKLPISLLFDGKAWSMLKKYEKRLDSFFNVKSNSNINKELIKIGKLAGIEKHFSFHSARHTNATLLIYKGANITTVQKLLGHRNLATTQIYSEVMESTIVRDLKKCAKVK